MSLIPVSYTHGTATFEAIGTLPTTVRLISTLSGSEFIALPLETAIALILWAHARWAATGGAFTGAFTFGGVGIDWSTDPNDPKVMILDGFQAVEFDTEDFANVVAFVGSCILAQAAMQTLFPQPAPPVTSLEDVAIMRWLEPDGTLAAETERPIVPVLANLAVQVGAGSPIVMYGPSGTPAGDPVRYAVETIEDAVFMGLAGDGPIRRVIVLRQLPLTLV